MLDIKSNRKKCNKALCLIFAFLLSINSFAAIVSDNDGSSFVTKAEFEAMKKSFAEQVENYNRSIGEKIDGAIAAYLAGIKLEKKEIVQTGFNLEGGTTNQVRFLGHTNNSWNFTNEIYGNDKIYITMIGTYQSSPSFYVYDMYDIWIFHGEYANTTDKSNTYFMLNADNTVNKIYWNVELNCNRNRIFYSTTNGWDGIIWSKCETQLEKPDALLNTNSAYVNVDNSKYYGYGLGRVDNSPSTPTPAAPYVNVLGRYIFQKNGGAITTGSDPSKVLNPSWATYTNEEEKEPTDISKQCNIQMTGKTINYGIHFCFQPNYALRGSRQTWNNINNVDEVEENLVDYGVTDDIQYAGGYWKNVRNLVSATKEVKGKGLKVHEEKDSAGNSTIFTDNIYYSTLKEQWEQDIAYTGGFPVYKATATGKLTFKVELGINPIDINFTKSQNDSMPSTTDSGLVSFDYRNINSSAWTKEVKNASLEKDETYEFTIELEKNDVVYLNGDLAERTCSFTQIGDAIFTTA